MSRSLERRIADMEARERVIWLTIRAGETRAQALARRFPDGRPADTDLVFLSYLSDDEPDDPPPDPA
jgi:hypothetical protein